MSKQITVDLVFNANTEQAQQQMRALKASMETLSSGVNIQAFSGGAASEFSKIQNSVISLKTNLQSAFNVDTGKLNLGKFNENLKRSGMTLKDYRKTLVDLGPEGQAAFQQLTTSIIQGELPLKRTKNLLTTMMDTFGSSIKWSIAYGAIHKFTEGMREAFDYAQELNNSLTNIRVITGQSADEMATFAKNANKAAQNLATTTTDYTKAALIYYRQGLTGEEVEKRTETTLKLANVTGKSAEEVSEWMTSVWNNFDNGSKSLEYYADVLSKLGVTTASSAEEIATGMQKFSAVANTVGLSYEYAASALATITAKTRQSADSVGTALKTLFSRMEQLKQGDTLEDGTTLGQYSEALAKVGVEIKDASGNLNSMNSIIDQAGEKWKGLAQDQKVALAQSVAGIRQYTQFIALMDNYDTFKENVLTAQGSEGTLQEQQNIWAESWEAANKRVKAATEGLYDNLINDKFFIDLENIFADLVSAVTEFVEAIGGLRTLLPLIAGWMLKAFGPTALSMIKGFTSNLMGPSQKQQNSVMALRKDAIFEAGEAAAVSDSNAGSAKVQGLKAEEEMLQDIESITRHLQDADIERLQLIVQTVREYEKVAESLGEQLDKSLEINEALTSQKNSMREKFMGQTKTGSVIEKVNVGGAMTEVDKIMSASVQTDEAIQGVNTALPENMQAALQNLSTTIKAQITDNPELTGMFEEAFGKNLFNALSNPDKISSLSGEKLNNLKNQLKDVTTETAANEKATKKMKKAISENCQGIENVDEASQNYVQTSRAQAAAEQKVTANQKAFTTATDNAAASVKRAKAEIEALSKVPLGEKIVSLVGTIGTLSAGLSMLVSAGNSIIDMIKGGEVSVSSVLGLLTSVGFGLPMVINGFKALTTAIGSFNAIQALSLSLNKANVASILELKIAEGSLLTTKKVGKALQAMGIAQDKIELVLKKLDEGLTLKQALATAGLSAATMKQVVANLFLNTTMLVTVGIILAVVAAAALLVVGIKALINWYNKDAIAAEKSAKEAKELGEQYEQLSQKYDNLKKSLEDYHNAQYAIDQLKEGTVEWKNAIQEANEKVLELLNNYPELSKYVVNENGRLKITNEEAALNEILQQKQNVYNAKLNAEAQAKSDANQAKRTELIRNELDIYNDANMVIASIGSAVIMGLGALAGPIGLALGAALSAPLAYTFEQNDKMAQVSENALDKIAEAVEIQGNAFFNDKDFEDNLKELDIVNQDLIDTLKENKGAVKDYTASLNEANKYQKLVDQQKVDSLMTSQGLVLGDHYSEHIQDLARKQYNKDRDALKIETTKLEGGANNPRAVTYDISNDEFWRDFALFGYGGTDIGNKYAKQYGTLMGMKDFEVTNFGDDQIEYKYKEGNEEKTGFASYSQMSEAIKDNEMQQNNKDVTKYVADLLTTVSNLSQSEDAVEQALGSFLENGNLSLLDPEIFDQASNDIDDWAKNNSEKLKQFGYTSAEEFTKEFHKEMLNYDREAAANAIARKTAEDIKAIYASGAKELNTTEEALESYADSLIASNDALSKNKKLAAEMAVQQARLAKGLNNVQKILSDYSDILKENNQNSFDFHEAIGKLSQELTKTFNMKVSTNFVKANLTDIQKMADNDVEALARVRKELNKDFIMNLNIKNSAKDSLLNALTDLNQIAENAELGTKLTLNNEEAIAAINEALYTGQATITDIEAMFNNADLSMPEYNTTTKPGPETHSHTDTHVKGPNGIEYDMSSDTTTTTDVVVPYFGDKEPTVTASGKMDYGGKGSLKTTINNNKNSLNNSLKYQGDTKSSSSGGSSSSSKKKPYEIDKEKDRYHEITKLIDRQTTSLNRLDKAKARVYGKQVLDLMDQEIAKQKEIIQSNKQYLAEAEQYYQRDRQGLLQNFAVQLDESGAIVNYGALEGQYIERLKAAIGNDDLYNQIDDEYKTFKDMASQYEQTLAKVEEQIDKVNEETDKLYEMNLEKITTTVQIKLDLADDDKVYIDFLMSQIEDDAFAAAEAIQLLGESTVVTINKVSATQQGIADVQDALARGEITQAQAIETLREYSNTLVDLNAELQDLRDSVQDKLSEAFDAWTEKLSKNRETIEFYGETIEHYQNIIDIVGKDNLGISNEFLRKMREARLQNTQDQLKAAKAEEDAINNTLAKYRAARAEAVAQNDEASVKEWDKQIEDLEEKSREAAQTTQSLFENTLEMVRDNFQATVEDIAENFSKQVSGIYDDLEELRSQWDRQQEVAERYLKTYEQTYEINKLNRKIQQDIDKTDNLKSQQELHGLQQEMLNMSKDNQKLSKYDLEYLQKKYDLMVAEQAFRDAQNAKSVVRLQRDSQGNFSYVYTADQNAVDEAIQNLEDKRYAYQEFSDKMDQELTERAIKLNEWADEQILAAAERYGKGTEEYEKAVEEILARYNGDMWYITDEYEKLTGYNLKVNRDFGLGVAETYNETYIGKIYPDYQSFEQLYEGTTGEIQTAVKDLVNAHLEAQGKNKKTFGIAGLDYNDFANKAETELGRIQTASAKTATDTQKMANDMDVAMDEVIGEVREFQSEFSLQLSTIQTNIGTTIDSINNLIKSYADLGTQADTTAEKLRQLAAAQGSANYTGSVSNSGNSSTTTTTTNTNGNHMRYDGSAAYSDADSTAFVGRVPASADSYTGKEFETNTNFKVFRDKDGVLYVRNKNKSSDWYKYSELAQDGTRGEKKYVYYGQKAYTKTYDTGGYTGEWGPDGRLAMLHQKEIVLNAHDTENFLAAINIVRDISDQIEKNALTMKYRNELINYKSNVKTSGDTLQQEVTIHAEFPNATNHNEIEEAFRNLTNLASQYANRKF